MSDDTYLDDDDYAEFVGREFDKDGAPKRPPPIGLVIVFACLAAMVIGVLLLTRA